MANKPLKSVQFPGLTDTYTIPQIDTTLAVAGKAADAKAAGDAIDAIEANIPAVDATLATAGAAADAKATGDEINGVKSAISVLEPTATSADVGKALIAKTVVDGKVTEYEFGEAGVGSDAAPVIINSASGAVASFADGGNGLPMQSLVCEINPLQSGTGDPSPSNVRPISGWTGVTVMRTGKNLWGGIKMAQDFEGAVGYSINTTAKTFTFKRSKADFKTDGFKANTRYTLILSASAEAENQSLNFAYTDGTFDIIYISSGAKTVYVATSNASKTVASITLRWSTEGTVTVYYDESGLFEGVVTAQDFAPYTGEQISVEFPAEAGTVYGGTVDVTTGVLTVTHAELDKTGYTVDTLYGGRSIRFGTAGVFKDSVSNRPYSSIGKYANPLTLYNWLRVSSEVIRLKIPEDATAEEIVDIADEFQLVLELTTPVTYQLTPQQVNTLLGINNVWHDANGDTNVAYCADTKLYIDTKLAALAASILNA